ncbi:MAG: hypothetical protein ACRDHL_11995 [Candidatus Promineifilaceae bacterium]
MDDTSRNDIRRLLKTFGVRADEAMVAHLARRPDVPALRVRLRLEDLTDYGATPPAEPLALEVEDIIRRQAE